MEFPSSQATRQYSCRNRDMRSGSRGDHIDTSAQLDILPTPHDRDASSHDPIQLMCHEATVIAEDPYLTDEQRVTDLVRLSDVIREIGRAYGKMGHTEKARTAIKEAKRCLELARTSQ